MTSVEFTSDIIRKTKFREKMRGYHPEEVDAFLERTAVAIDQLQTRLAEITERALKAESANESNSQADESIRRTLTLAQRTAEMAVNEANEDAARIRSEAQTDADTQRAESDETCRELVAQATSEAETLRTQAEEALVVATATATSTVADAERQAEELRSTSAEAIATAERESADGISRTERESAERIEIAQRESDERIAAAHREADEAIAVRAETARRELETAVASLTGQRVELRSQVEALALYLAGERARVLDALTTATAGFELQLAPTTPSPAAEAALAADVEAARIDPYEPAVVDDATFERAAEQGFGAQKALEIGISNEDALDDRSAAAWFSPEHAPGGEAETAAAMETTIDSVEAPVEEPAPAQPFDYSAGEAAPDEAHHDEVAHDEVAHDEVAHDEVAHDEVAHDEVAHDEVAHDEMAHDEMAHDEMAHDEMAQDEMAHNEPHYDEAAHEDVAASTLLFTLEDEMRREAEREVRESLESKPRKTLLGRRRG